MIDFAWLDLCLLGLAALGYVLRPQRSRLVFHDPISASLAAFLGTDLGLGATAGAIGAGVIEGGGLGAGISALTGGDPLKGALFGAAGGGLAGGAGSLFSDAGSAAAGAAGSTAGAALDPATAATGGLFGEAGTSTASGALTAGQAASAAIPAAGSALSPASATIGATADPSAALSPATAGATTGSGGGGAATGGPSGGSFLSNLFGSGSSGNSVIAPATDIMGNAVPADSSAAVNFGGGGGGGTSGVSSFLSKNAGNIASVGLMGINYLMGQKPLPAQQQLQEAAAENATLGKTLAGYSITGTLPPGMKAIVDQNTNAAKAAIRSQYASLGYAGSTAELEALRQVDESATAQIAKMANQLMQQGRSFSALSEEEFATLLNTESAQEQSFQQALAKFAGGLAGAKLS